MEIEHLMAVARGQVATATVDITKRKWADEALRSSEERFRSIFELGLIGMAITSPDKGIVAVNDEICRILGYERAELLKKQQPQINLHIVNGCKHMVHWDAFDDLMRLGVPFLKS